jgi:TonB family protein
MTTLLELLSLLGRTTWAPVWVPVLAWTGLALPFWALLRRTDRLHPTAEYRLWQTLLAALPLGVGAAALFDGWGTASAALSGAGLSVVVMPAVEPTGGAPSPTSTLAWTHAVGLATVLAGAAGLVGLVRLALDAVAAVRVRRTVGRDAFCDALQARADRWADALGVRRRVRTRTAPEVEVPVTLGGLRPVLLLPPHLTDDADALRMTLLHELVHVRRYDDLAHLAERLVAAVCTVHPLVGRIIVQIEAARERACDAAVLADEHTSPPDYARLLTAFADRASSRRLGALSLSESPSSLTTRLRAMKSSVSDWLASPLSLAATLLAVGMAVVFGVVACSDGAAPTASAPTGDSTPRGGDARASDEVFVVVEQRPECGGVQALADHIEYPELAREAGIEGRVSVQFVVDETGDVTDPTVTKGVHEALDAAARSAVKHLECKPGRQRGEPVKVKMSLPVTFALPNEAPDSEDAGSGTSSVAPDGPGKYTVPGGGTVAGHDVARGPTQDGVRPPAARIEGGLRALYKELSYPTLAERAGIEGRVVVRFTLDGSGQVQDPTVVQSPHEMLDAAALEALSAVSFNEGTVPNSTEMTLPIAFYIPKSSESAPDQS